MLNRQSALADASIVLGGDQFDALRRPRMGKLVGWNLTQIAAFAEKFTEFENAVRPVLHGNLPPRIGEITLSSLHELAGTLSL